MELKFYRHKVHKDLFLVRNSSVFGGGENTQFYMVTKSVIEAIKSYNYHGDNFLSWYHSFPNNKTETTLSKEMEFDGYKGTLTKKIELPISEFELVTLREVSEC